MNHENDKFCSNPQCVLHVSSEDGNVVGHGDWASMPNGFMFGRVLVNGRFYCHVCAEDPENPPRFD